MMTVVAMVILTGSPMMITPRMRIVVTMLMMEDDHETDCEDTDGMLITSTI